MIITFRAWRRCFSKYSPVWTGPRKGPHPAKVAYPTKAGLQRVFSRGVDSPDGTGRGLAPPFLELFQL
eukprot:3655858-Pyramimonas_sp.AAC.1